MGSPFLRRARIAALALTVVGALLLPTPAPAAERRAAEGSAAQGRAAQGRAAQGKGSASMKQVTNLRWRASGAQLGTDLEFATINKRDYAVAGSYLTGMHLIDITDPRSPREVGVYPCALAQGDVQVFRQGARTLATYTNDNGYGGVIGQACYEGIARPTARFGTFLVDISNPARPKPVSFLPAERGSHNMTVHPSGLWLYNSDSEGRGGGEVEIWDIKNPAKPKRFNVVGLGPRTEQSAHDITFSADGNRAYAAALSYTAILDTSFPGAPRFISSIVDPAIDLHHQADPVTMLDAGGVALSFLVLTDELNGASNNTSCPGGGLHVYNVTGPLERAPVKMGVFFIPDTRARPFNLRCTSHVLRMHPKEKVMTIGWYAAGSRVIDISNLIGVAAGSDSSQGSLGLGMREVGFFEFPNSETWAAKTNRIAPDGSFYLFANDLTRGFDVLHYRPVKGPVAGPGGTDPGRWLTPAQALAEVRAAGRKPVDFTKPLCVIPPNLVTA